MDNFARAACPGTSDEAAVRLRGSAMAAGRAYAVALRYFRKRQSAAEQTRPATEPVPMPNAPLAEPARDKPQVPPGLIAPRPGAEPMPRRDLTTGVQRHAAFTRRRDPMLAAEAPMLAGQAMLADAERGQAVSAQAHAGSG